MTTASYIKWRNRYYWYTCISLAGMLAFVNSPERISGNEGSVGTLLSALETVMSVISFLGVYGVPIAMGMLLNDLLKQYSTKTLLLLIAIAVGYLMFVLQLVHAVGNES